MKLFDSHLHIIDPRFPLVVNQGYLPPNFLSTDYIRRVESLDVVGGAVVSGSFQGFDQTYLIDAIQSLGENFVGVTQLPFETSDDELIRLNESGVRALRFNIKRGGSEDISRLDYFARRIYELVGWHTELYIDSTQIPELSRVIEKLPAVSVDHLGLSEDGFQELLALVEKGIKVKATGFGRVDFDITEAIRQIYSINPNALMFGTDLPSTRAERPFKLSDLDIVSDALKDTQAISKVLYENACNWYLKGK